MIKTLYSIVPKDDGFHYLCEGWNGGYKLVHKEDDYIDGSPLSFTSYEAADSYIKMYLDETKFEVEPYGVEEDDC